MPFFKTTHNILKKPDEDELYEDNWFDKPFLTLPPSTPWDYQREMKIEDVEIWEVLTEQGGGLGVYAAWLPHAEFYLVTTGIDFRSSWLGSLKDTTYNYNDKFWETYYGSGAQGKVKKRAEELGMILPNYSIWVEPEDMWLYTKN